jgi:endonuclease III
MRSLIGLMPRESLAAKAVRTAAIIDGLRRTYPEAHCELNYSNPLELLIATILSAQCTDRQVNIVTETLFQKYRTAADYANADPATLEQDLRRIGLFRNKAKSLRACCQALLKKHNGQVPQTMAELTQLAGVGRKTANVVLGNAFHQNEGVVVDTHVARLAERFKLTSETRPEHIEAALMKLVPREHWTMFSHWLIWHGRRCCFARRPDCAQCEVAGLCPSRAKE